MESGEFDQILSSLSASGNRYSASAFVLAIETSSRQGVLLALRWEWIDQSRRMIRFPDYMLGTSNKGVPAVLPLSARAIAALDATCTPDVIGVQLWLASGLVLATTANAIRLAWKRVLGGLGIQDLRWHDLHQEAASKLFERGLHPMEVASITGHRSMQMLRYTPEARNFTRPTWLAFVGWSAW